MKSICSPPATLCLRPTAVVGGEERLGQGIRCLVTSAGELRQC